MGKLQVMDAVALGNSAFAAAFVTDNGVGKFAFAPEKRFDASCDFGGKTGKKSYAESGNDGSFPQSDNGLKAD